MRVVPSRIIYRLYFLLYIELSIICDPGVCRSQISRQILARYIPIRVRYTVLLCCFVLPGQGEGRIASIEVIFGFVPTLAGLPSADSISTSVSISLGYRNLFILRTTQLILRRPTGNKILSISRFDQLTRHRRRKLFRRITAGESIIHRVGLHPDVRGIVQGGRLSVTVGQTGLAGVRIIGVVILAYAPIRIGVRGDGEGDDQLVTMPPIGLLDHHIVLIGVVETRDADGLTGYVDGNAAGIIRRVFCPLGRCPIARRFPDLNFYFTVLVVSIGQCSEIEVLRQGIGEDCLVIDIDFRGDLSGDGLENTVQVTGITGGEVVALTFLKARIDRSLLAVFHTSSRGVV